MNYYEMLLARKLAKGELPPNAYLLKTASGSLVSFSDGADLPMPSFICNIDAVQDLHGYDAPWVGGAGKNKCPVILSDDVSAAGYAATVENDGAIIVNGTWTGTANNIIGINKQVKFNLPSGSYVLNGATVDNYNDYGISLQVYNWDTSQAIGNTSATGYAEFTLEAQAEVSVRIYISNSKASGKTIPSGGIKLYPMIRLSSITDASWEPYSNICPISGHTGLDAWVRGKNLAEDGFAWNVNADGIIESAALYNTSVIPVRKNERYIQNIDGVLANIGVIAFYYERPSIGSQSYNKSRIVNLKSPIFTAPINGYAVIRNTATDTNIQIEKGNTATSYEPYNPNSQTIQVSWQTEAGEVFGGYVDLVSGELTVTDGYIASYNGETLPSTWISDRDTYAEGTSPTTGAEVVYKLANPQTYQLDGNQIKSLLGNNNAWCNTGDVTLEYFGKGDA